MLTGGLPNYAVYETADGRYMAMGALENKFFQQFCKHIERTDLLKLPLAPGVKGEPLRQALVSLFKSKTRDEWAAALATADCCVTPVLAAEEALQSDQARIRSLVDVRNGKPAIAFPVLFDGLRGAAVGDAPKLGADNTEVLG
jgi:crotonobetainyl-CoA:carnitine CoA-transferase CaiB-like acyl-CoA transferase